MVKIKVCKVVNTIQVNSLNHKEVKITPEIISDSLDETAIIEEPRYIELTHVLFY